MKNETKLPVTRYRELFFLDPNQGDAANRLQYVVPELWLVTGFFILNV